jgi:hypothetical protein
MEMSWSMWVVKGLYTAVILLRNVDYLLAIWSNTRKMTWDKFPLLDGINSDVEGRVVYIVEGHLAYNISTYSLKENVN